MIQNDEKNECFKVKTLSFSDHSFIQVLVGVC